MQVHSLTSASIYSIYHYRTVTEEYSIRRLRSSILAATLQMNMAYTFSMGSKNLAMIS